MTIEELRVKLAEEYNANFTFHKIGHDQASKTIAEVIVRQHEAGQPMIARDPEAVYKAAKTYLIALEQDLDAAMLWKLSY